MVRLPSTRCFIFVLSCLSSLLFRVWNTAHASMELHEINVRSNFSSTPRPLTLEKIWEIDPGQPNPHLQRWVLGRKMEIEGMTAFLKDDLKYGVYIQGIQSTQSAYIRPPGPWYFSIDDFRCDPALDLGFGNEEGSRRSLVQANEVWVSTVNEAKTRLSQSLARVATDSSALALKRGEQIFQVWLGDLDLRWRDLVSKLVRTSEWDFYIKTATEKKICGKTYNDRTPRLLRSIMEPASGSPVVVSQLLARAPVKLWNGLFTIRGEIEVGEKKLNGRFLIDSSANRSLINPEWLRSQGILPEWIKIPNVPLQYIQWNRLENKNQTLAPRAWVSQVTVSGLKLPLHEFSLFDTEIFSPPKSIGSCCDAVFGIDFLKLFPIEFQADRPSEIRIWPKENFRPPLNFSWIEISVNSAQEIISQCLIEDQPEKLNRARMQNLRWDFGSEEALVLKSPHHDQKKWNIRCDQLYDLATNLVEKPDQETTYGSQNSRLPRAGLSLLSRGNFILDLPHGKLWCDPQSFSRPFAKKNTSGLEVYYTFDDGNRVLKVGKISNTNKITVPLRKAGLKVGMTITEINERAAEEFDLWELNQLLAGTPGNRVKLKWKNKKKVFTSEMVLF